MKSLYLVILLLASSSILASNNKCEFALFERENLDSKVIDSIIHEGSTLQDACEKAEKVCDVKEKELRAQAVANHTHRRFNCVKMGISYPSIITRVNSSEEQDSVCDKLKSQNGNKGYCCYRRLIAKGRFHTNKVLNVDFFVLGPDRKKACNSVAFRCSQKGDHETSITGSYTCYNGVNYNNNQDNPSSEDLDKVCSEAFKNSISTYKEKCAKTKQKPEIIKTCGIELKSRISRVILSCIEDAKSVKVVEDCAEKHEGDISSKLLKCIKD